jgi:hypothetical protein
LLGMDVAVAGSRIGCYLKYQTRHQQPKVSGSSPALLGALEQVFMPTILAIGRSHKACTNGLRSCARMHNSPLTGIL